jgi:hypothetical protein
MANNSTRGCGMRGTKILVVLMFALGLAAAWAPAADAQVFIGEHCWTLQPPGQQSPALARFGVTNQGGPYYILQGYVTGVPNGRPILFGSGIFVGGSLYLTFTMTMEEGTTYKNASQMQGVLNGTTLNGSMWELGNSFNSTNPTTPFNPYFENGMMMTYTSCP